MVISNETNVLFTSTIHIVFLLFHFFNLGTYTLLDSGIYVFEIVSECEWDWDWVRYPYVVEEEG